MKRIFILLSAMMLTVLGGEAFAQKKKSENDYNLRKAYEVLNEENDQDKGLDLVNRQIRETPDNVEALLLRVRLLRSKHEIGSAIADINHALKVNKPKKSEIPNSVLYWWKAYLYKDMDDLDNAAAAFKTAYELAQKDNKEDLHSISFDYAQCLYSLERPDEADVVYRRMLDLDETDQAAMIGLVRNMIDRGQYREALDLLEKCRKFDAGYGEIYRFKMRAHNRLGETAKAIDAGLEWMDRDNDAQGDSLMFILAKSPNYAEANIKARVKKSDDPFLWKVFLSLFYDHTRHYAKAVKCLDEIEAEFGHFDELNEYRAEYYGELGLFEQAVAELSVLLDKEPDWTTLCNRGIYYMQIGDLDNAVEDFTAAIELEPQRSFAYYRRGWCYEMLRDTTKALADYDLGIELDDDYPYLYLMRGEMRLLLGDNTGATTDFEAVLQRDTVVSSNSCRQYALHFLGQDKEAEEWMEKVIALDPDECGNYYDKACLLARMGRLQESVAALRTAFEKGHRNFAHIRLDDDMDPIRELPEFKELIAEYEAIHAVYLKDNDIVVPEEREAVVTEIAVKRNPGGTFEIPCDINGLPLQMIFDTGASDVSISSVEANFMLKNGYLSEKDIKGKRYYQVANGQLSEGTVITLREVKIGDAVLHNVDASVVKNQYAPLLFGQSAMERFGTITIDNANNKLVIKH